MSMGVGREADGDGDHTGKVRGLGYIEGQSPWKKAGIPSVGSSLGRWGPLRVWEGWTSGRWAGGTWGCWGDTVLSPWSGGRPGDTQE